MYNANVGLVGSIDNHMPLSSFGSEHVDGLVQKRRNSSALAMELRLSGTNPSMCCVEIFNFKLFHMRNSTHVLPYALKYYHVNWIIETKSFLSGLVLKVVRLTTANVSNSSKAIGIAKFGFRSPIMLNEPLSPKARVIQLQTIIPYHKDEKRIISKTSMKKHTHTPGKIHQSMMTSSTGNFFRITGPLWG